MNSYDQGLHRAVDTLLLLAFAVFCFVFAVLFATSQQPTEAIILIFLSIGSFGLAGYHATH